ncbi:MAG: GNAT family N-acetyltransferase [Bacilli bacterium]|nr:GNAT family N-acetyltransferase [Bacilli bacterium]
MDLVVKNEIKAEDFVELRKEMGWNEIPVELVKRAVHGSMFNICVYDKDKCIGMGRLVGDGALKGMLTDVMVKKEYQGKGIGKIIVTSLIKNLEEMVKPGECFQLEASPTQNNRDFYVKCGLKHKPENQDGVYLWVRK